MNCLKKRFSIKELADRWRCTENTIIEYIEDGLLPVYSKSYLLTYTSDNAVAKIQLLRNDTEIAAKLDKFIFETNHKATNSNPFSYPLTIVIGEDCQLDDENIALATLDNDFSQLFVLKKDVEEFEKQFSNSTLDKNATANTNTNLPTIQRTNYFNEYIALVIADFIENNGYQPTTLEVLNRMKHKPLPGTIIDFRDNKVSIEGSTPKPIANLERTIKRLLSQQK